MTAYALFRDNKQISKPHSTKEAAMIEAYEQGVVVVLKGHKFLVDDHYVREVKDE